MKNVFVTQCLSGYECLSRALMDIWRRQYDWLRTQRQIGMRMWTAMTPLATSTVPPKSQSAGEAENIEKQATERMQKGLAPPREIYDVQNRGRIDWASAPEWARPSDPDSFEGCSHEG
jgi:hypothetical protein